MAALQPAPGKDDPAPVAALPEAEIGEEPDDRPGQHLMQIVPAGLDAAPGNEARAQREQRAGIGHEGAAFPHQIARAMDRRGIATRHQNKLLAKLAPMHREVINR